MLSLRDMFCYISTKLIGALTKVYAHYSTRGSTFLRFLKLLVSTAANSLITGINHKLSRI